MNYYFLLALEDVIFCNHDRSRLLAIADPSLQNSDCQFVAYKCNSYSDFTAGKCADCGSNGEMCKPLDFDFPFWENSSNYNVNDIQTPNQFYIQTGADPQYCIFHYQIVVNYFIFDSIHSFSKLRPKKIQTLENFIYASIYFIETNYLNIY